MSFTSLVLHFAAPLPKLESFQRFLFIGPHPDDIEIGAGATAAKLTASGKQVCFVICTDGRFGSGSAPAGISADELAALRKSEAIRSAEVLGVRDVRFLDLSDGAMYDTKDLFSRLCAVVSDFQPEVIFAPDPCVDSECHPDHLNVGNAARNLACFAPYGDIMRQYGQSAAPVRALAYYMTAKPNAYVNTGSTFAKQLSAIFDCHLSQFPRDSAASKSIELYLKLRSLDFGLRSFCAHAEGFRVLGEIHMHCLPEAGK